MHSASLLRLKHTVYLIRQKNNITDPYKSNIKNLVDQGILGLD